VVDLGASLAGSLAKIRGHLHRVRERVRSGQRRSIALLVRSAAILTTLLIAGLMMHRAIILTSWASSLALILSAPNHPSTAARRIIGGHIISALVGTGLVAVGGHSIWLLVIGVPFAMVITHWLDVLHPPAIANSAIPLSISIPSATFLLLATAGGCILAIAALLVRKSDAERS
jgi:CBS-domain-containing membrane protein